MLLEAGSPPGEILDKIAEEQADWYEIACQFYSKHLCAEMQNHAADCTMGVHAADNAAWYACRQA